jgi:hypothetical protein
MDFSKLEIDNIEILDIDGYKGTNHLLIKPKGKEYLALICVKARVWVHNKWYLGIREESVAIEIKEKKPLDIDVHFWMDKESDITDPSVELDLDSKKYRDYDIDRGFYYFLSQHSRYIEHLYLSLNSGVSEQRKEEIEEILKENEDKLTIFKERLFVNVVDYLKKEKVITIIPVENDGKTENKYDIFRTRREEL